MNEINIILEGKEYQIDVQKAKKLGILKEKNTRCKSWKEFINKYQNKQGFIYNINDKRIELTRTPIMTADQLTEDEAVAIKVFSNLLKLRRDWIGDWEPDWHTSENKYCIVIKDTHISVGCFWAIHHAFSFPTREMAEEFLNCFRNLFEQCKNLI